MFERLRSILPSTALALLIGYFIFHALTGERGWLTAGQRDATLTQRRQELSKLQLQRVDLEARVRLLRNGSLSADMVEERARAVLGFVDPKDYVIREAP